MQRCNTFFVPCAVFLAAILTACSPHAARVASPEIVDTWQPPEGTVASPPLSHEELAGLFAYDAQAPLDIREEKRLRDGGVTVIELNYASPRGGRVPAILVVPDGQGPFAGIVLMHGSGGHRWQLLPLAKAYARLGAAAITIGAPSSRPEHDNYAAFAFREKDGREQIQLIVDLRRAIDLLAARPDVDPRRLAYMGISYGGAMGGLLAAVEDRVRAYALMVGDGGLVNHFSGAVIAGMPDGARREWLAAMWPIEPIRYVGGAAPAALLFQNGTLDTQVPPADALRYQRAGSEPKTVLWYEADHGLSTEAYQDQAEWLRETVGIAGRRAAFPFRVRIVLIAWVLAAAGSLGFVAFDLWRTRLASLGARLLWLLTIAVLGPVGLAAYCVSGRRKTAPGKPALPASPFVRAIGSSAWAASGNTCGIVVVLGLVTVVPVFQGLGLVPILVIMILVSSLVGWLTYTAAQWVAGSDPDYPAVHRRPLLAGLASTVLVVAAGYPVTIWLLNRYLGPWVGPFGLDLAYPPLWGVLGLAALAGALAVYPRHALLIRRVVNRRGRMPSGNAV